MGQSSSSLLQPPALTVFSGHDTVIAPLLSALGVYHGDICRWPPYASRIAFELYEESTPKNSPMQDAGVETGARFYVRVLFNGKVLRGLRGCSKDEELCPMDDFASGVASLLRGAPDLKAACLK